MSYATSVDTLLSASPSGNYLSVFSNYDPTSASSSVYNTNLWGGGGHTIDWSGIVWWEDHDGVNNNFSRSAAITKRHLICTQHGTTQVGFPLSFVKPDGTSVTRTSIDSIEFGPDGDTDGLLSFRVHYLNADLPAGIAIYPVSGDQSLNANLAPPPAIRINQFHEACLGDLNVSVDQFVLAEPTDPTSDIYYKTAISGDSGGATFLLNGTQLIYYGNVTLGSAGGDGPRITFRLSELLSACATLDARNANTGYVPTLSPLLVPGNLQRPSIYIGV